jgi:dienelactone hydrolase
MSRNLSVNAYFRALAARHVPRYRFGAGGPREFSAWRRELLPLVRASLGRLPAKVPLNPEVQAEWREDGLVKQRILFDVEAGLSAVAYLFRPENLRPGQKVPGILACHGHGPWGKDAVMGNRSNPQLAAEIEATNYDYGLQMAKAGYAVIAIDWRGFGERDDRRKPHNHDVDLSHDCKRDLCNLHYLRANILGMTVLGMDVYDGSCAIDLLCDQPYVDANRIGVMGLSFGGTMATWMSLCDDRIKAADVICYSDRFADFGMRDVNFCGSQITPGLYDLCDVPDLHGLIAPRPLLVEIGAFDNCFLIDSAMSCYREVEQIYAVAGAGDKLELDLFEGGHRWGGRRTLAFFRKHLGVAAAATMAAAEPTAASTGVALTLPSGRTIWRDVHAGASTKSGAANANANGNGHVAEAPAAIPVAGATGSGTAAAAVDTNASDAEAPRAHEAP